MSDLHHSNFGIWVRELRRSHDLTQAALADRVGCAIVTIRHVEAGRVRPSMQIIERLSRALDVPHTEQPAFRAAGRQSPTPAMTHPNSSLLEGIEYVSIPKQPDSLVGREEVLDHIAFLLTERTGLLLTLVGPAGVGKTSVAVAVARSLSEHWRDGVVEVALEHIRNPELLIPTIIHATHLSHNSPLDPKHWQHWLAERHLLIVLDNMEQIIEASVDLATLHATAPGVSWLISSRIRLDVSREVVVTLDPLACPPADHRNLNLAQLKAWPATALFLDRAQPLLETFDERYAATVAAICRQIDGIPLALELAAARCRVLGLTDLLANLNARFTLLTNGPSDRSDRQRTLRGAIEWSYSLLTEREQAVLLAGSVFAGGWTIPALQAVVDQGAVGEPPLMDVLDSLIRQSLVIADRTSEHTRYRMLDTIRAFAHEHLKASGHSTDLYRRHADFYLQMVTLPIKDRPEPSIWVARLEIESANLRFAMRWWIDQQDAGKAVRMAISLSRWWDRYGYRDEARQNLELLLPLLPQVAPADQASILNWLANFHFLGGYYTEARRIFCQSLDLYSSINNRQGLMYVYSNLGLVEQAFGNYEVAEVSFRKSRTLAEQEDDPEMHTSTTLNLGSMLLGLGRAEEALDLYREIEPVASQLADRALRALFLLRLGDALIDLDYWDGADQALQESLAMFLDLRQHDYCGEALAGLSRLQHRAGFQQAALKFASQSLEHYRRIPEPQRVLTLLEHVAVTALEQGDMELPATVLAECDDLRRQFVTPRMPREQLRWEQVGRLLARQCGADGARRSSGVRPTLDIVMEEVEQWLLIHSDLVDAEKF